jgi:aspartyl-tRNA synthetase
MKTFYRTRNCGELRKNNQKEEVVLSGWINKIREHGNLIFIDLKDRYGITQIVISKEHAKNLKKGFVIQVKGLVEVKPEPNLNIKTGEIEIKVSNLNVLSESNTLPIDLDHSEMTEDTRLKYRYLDLRRKEMQENIILRHKIIKTSRDFFNEKKFIEIETPILAKSTPEGARDYLVPSRVNKGKFYALPQSPQIFKQLLMISGFDRYMQIVKCFRDEDLRKDRQPEFTQLDIEMSFVNEEDVIKINEEYLKYLFKNVMNVNLQIPFQRLTYEDAMNNYGSDKPDIRFDLKLIDITNIAKKSEFNVFKNAKCIKCIITENDFSRKEIDDLTNLVKIYKAKGLAFVKINDNQFESGISKFIENIESELINNLNLKNNSTIFFVADNNNIVNESLGALRNELGKKLNLIKDEFKFCWVTNFPMFEWNEENKRYISMHHPFTMPNIKTIDELDKEITKIPSIAYDITLNGTEIGGGSIRIHDQKIQSKIFELLGINKEEAKQKFGFLLDALSYGAPPHGGIAYGIDRLVMLMAKQDSIREVIAFPKTKNAEDLMMNAPSEIDQKQLDEVGMRLK